MPGGLQICRIAAVAWLVQAAACALPPDGVEHDLAITATDRYRTEDGTALERRLRQPLEVWSWTGGAWVPLEIEIGVEDAQVTAAPPGPIYVRYGEAWIATSAPAVDLGRVRLGRADLTPAPPGTALELMLDGLTPWQPDHELQLYSTGAALWQLDSVAGAELDATSVEARIELQASMLASRGDELWLGQMTTGVLAGAPYSALARSARTSPESIPGQAVALTASLVDLGSSGFAVDYRTSEFDQVRLADQPVITRSWYDVGVAALPGAAEHGHYAVAADLAIARVTDRSGGEVAGRLDFADPFPASWTRMATFVAWYPVTLDGHLVFDAVWTRDRAEALDGRPIEPLVSAPRQVRFDDGRVRWQPPERGIAAGYRVTLYVVNGAGVEVAGEILTTERELRIPPGMLPEGVPAGAVQVTAIAGPMDLGAAPFALGLPYGEASFTRAITGP
ncbi:MAG TPA: hypothetical protein VML75_25485 [Kofleriaceae bacterium]|nr:hypothetical protein [Kofleriaceae bacterium]